MSLLASIVSDRKRPQAGFVANEYSPQSLAECPCRQVWNRTEGRGPEGFMKAVGATAAQAFRHLSTAGLLTRPRTC
jgi:hypothetical protein